MLHRTVRRAASSPGRQVTEETKPIKFTNHMLPLRHAKWFDNQRGEYTAVYREKRFDEMWPIDRLSHEKPWREVLKRKYSRAALEHVVDTIPPYFQVRDVPRPPQRIRAYSDGIVGRWFTNYWTLHAVKYQCLLAGLPWRHGERHRPVSNFEEPFYYVDFDESRAIREWRSRWINVNRSLVGMSKRIRELDEDSRFISHKRLQDKYWSERRTLISRVKAMHQSGALTSSDPLPLKTMNIRAFDAEK